MGGYRFAALALVACHSPSAPPVDLDASMADATRVADAALDATPAACVNDGDCAGPHQACDDTVTPRACACVCGYAPDGAGGCAWTGVIADPGLSGTGAWTGATFDPTDAQSWLIDPGSAHVALADRMTQTFCMPRRARAEPLVATVSYRNTDSYVFPAFGIGPAWHYDFGGGPAARTCLGEAEYAGETTTGRGEAKTITFMSQPPWGIDGLTPKGYDVDHVEIVPANPGECPAPGAALNGDGESDGGWIVDTGGTGTFSFDPGAGANGSRGIRFHAPHGTPGSPANDVTASTEIAIPLGGSPALSFYRRTSNVSCCGLVNMWLDPYVPVSVPDLGDTAAGVEHLCIPGSMRGSVRRLTIRLLTGSNVYDSDAVFDDVAVVDDPACGTDPVITDPGFDAPYRLIGAYDPTQANQVHTAQDPALAHTGAGVLVLEHAADCSSYSFSSFTARVSEPTPGAAGAALAFYYKVPANPDWTLRISPDAPTVDATPIVQDGAWHRGVRCVTPLPVGHDEGVTFELLTKPTGTCRSTITAYVDDLALTTDPSCPTM